MTQIETSKAIHSNQPVPGWEPPIDVLAASVEYAELNGVNAANRGGRVG